MDFKELFIKEDFIKLDSALKFSNVVSSGGMAKMVIKDGEVLVNGEVCTIRGKKLHINDTFCFNNSGFIIKNENN